MHKASHANKVSGNSDNLANKRIKSMTNKCFHATELQGLSLLPGGHRVNSKAVDATRFCYGGEIGQAFGQWSEQASDLLIEDRFQRSARPL